MARYIIINDRHIIFQHIPRTGGTWVEQMLTPLQVKAKRWTMSQPIHLPRKHVLLSHYHRRGMRDVRYAFCFVRHPLSYYETTWKYFVRSPRLKGVVKRWAWHPQARAARQFLSGGRHDFNAWVSLMLKHEPMWVTRLFENYCGPEGGEYMDFIGRQEDLVTDFIEILDAFGFGLTEGQRAMIRKAKRRNEAPGKLQWSVENQSAVEETERIAMDRFYGPNRGRKYYAGIHQDKTQELAAVRRYYREQGRITLP